MSFVESKLKYMFFINVKKIVHLASSNPYVKCAHYKELKVATSDEIPVSIFNDSVNVVELKPYDIDGFTIYANICRHCNTVYWMW